MTTPTLRPPGRLERRVDGLGAWLCRTRRGSYVAEWLWRVCRMW